MRADRFLAVGLVVAVAALAGTTAWAVVKATDNPSTTNYYGSMMGGNGKGNGMMGNGGGSMMGVGNAGSMMGNRGGMMGSYSSAQRGNPVGGPAEAKRLAQRFAERLGLKADEVLQFQRNFYVTLVDKKGRGATEVLVDPQTGDVTIEYGPAMMWNTRYGYHGGNGGQMMGSYGTGMMGGAGGMMGGGMMGSGGMMGGVLPATGTRVTLDRARGVAERWLSANRSGLKVESGGDAFPGYYTFEVLKQGKIDGMMSVNAITGAVIYHWWHGPFVTELT